MNRIITILNLLSWYGLLLAAVGSAALCILLGPILPPLLGLGLLLLVLCGLIVGRIKRLHKERKSSKGLRTRLLKYLRWVAKEEIYVFCDPGGLGEYRYRVRHDCPYTDPIISKTMCRKDAIAECKRVRRVHVLHLARTNRRIY